MGKTSAQSAQQKTLASSEPDVHIELEVPKISKPKKAAKKISAPKFVQAPVLEIEQAPEDLRILMLMRVRKYSSCRNRLSINCSH
jgi:DNA polymerase III delta subunit